MTPVPSSPRTALDALVNWERRDRDAGMRVGLEPALDLCARLGAPQARARAVHVAGTKGKGSLCALVDAGLRRAGLRVGRYSSPHVERIEERIAIDGEPLAADDFDRALSEVLAAREEAARAGTAGAHSTWFDVLTATAFVAFRRAGVDWWVVECGLGGRLDSTNVLDGEVCAITSIDLEHTAVLGSTRARIAAEKAGILWAGTRAVVGLADPASGSPDEAAAAVAARAAELGLAIQWQPPAGSLVERNRALAGRVLDALGARGVRAAAPDRALGAWVLDELPPDAATLPGRLERFQVGPTAVILDGAHVASSLALVADDLRGAPGLDGPAIAIAALGRDKRAPAFLKALTPLTDSLLCTSTGSGLHLPPEELSRLATAAGIHSEAMADPVAALHHALEHAQGRWILGVGSLHLAGALRPELRRLGQL